MSTHSVVRHRRFALAGIAGITALATATLSSPAGASPRLVAQFSGAPIKVGVTAPVGSPIENVPQIFAGVEAAARAINKAGGIKGHKVEVVTCNNQVNPNMELSCVNDAIASGVVAMVGNLVTINSGPTEAALEAAKTADVAGNAIAASQFNDQVAFPLIFNQGLAASCATKGLSKSVGGSKVAGVTIQLPNVAPVLKTLQGSASNAGTTYSGDVSVGFTTVDFAPIVAQVTSLNANVIFPLLSQSQGPELITTSHASGKTWAYCFTDGTLSGKQLEQLSPQFSQMFTVSAFPPLTAASQFPQLNTFIRQMKAEAASGDAAASTDVTNYVFEALNSWAGMQVFYQVAKSINGPIDHASFLTAIKKAKVNLGFLPPIDFAKPIGSGQFPHVYNSRTLLLRWDKAKNNLFLVPSGTVKDTFSLSGLGQP